jgi:hypothetical protein
VPLLPSREPRPRQVWLRLLELEANLDELKSRSLWLARRDGQWCMCDECTALLDDMESLQQALEG